MSTVLIVLWFLIAIGIIFAIWVIKSFKHTLIERHRTQYGEIIQIHKVREFQDKNRVIWWQKLKGFKKLNAPDSDAVNISSIGRKFAECVVTSEGNSSYIRINSVKDGVKVQGLSTDDRLALINEFERSNAYIKQSISDKLFQIAPLAFMLIVIICGMVFWGEIAKPVLEARQIGVQEESIHKETLLILKDIKQNTQSFRPSPPTPSTPDKP